MLSFAIILSFLSMVLPSCSGQVLLQDSVPVDSSLGLLHYLALSNRSDLFLGAASLQSELADPFIASRYHHDFNILVAGNECKIDATEPQPGVFTLQNCQNMANRFPDLKFRGHTTLWHSQVSSFFAQLPVANLTDAIQRHVTGVISNSQLQSVYSWDVANEVVSDGATASDNVTTLLRPTLFSRLPSFLDVAFHAARFANPNAKLVINDYNTGPKNGKTAALLNLVRDLQSRHVPIDAIGFQMHIGTTYYPSYSDLMSTFMQVAQMGLDVHVTELDVSARDNSTAEMRLQASIYATVLRACLDSPNCKTFVVWGVTDNISWLGESRHPLLFARGGVIKPAYIELMATLETYKNAPKSATTTTTKSTTATSSVKSTPTSATMSPKTSSSVPTSSTIKSISSTSKPATVTKPIPTTTSAAKTTVVPTSTSTVFTTRVIKKATSTSSATKTTASPSTIPSSTKKAATSTSTVSSTTTKTSMSSSSTSSATTKTTPTVTPTPMIQLTANDIKMQAVLNNFLQNFFLSAADFMSWSMSLTPQSDHNSILDAANKLNDLSQYLASMNQFIASFRSNNVLSPAFNDLMTMNMENVQMQLNNLSSALNAFMAQSMKVADLQVAAKALVDQIQASQNQLNI